MEQLVVTFEQSRNDKGVAQLTLEYMENLVVDLDAAVWLYQVVKGLRSATIEAHGIDLMPPDDGSYRFDPWPPRLDTRYNFVMDKNELIYTTTLLWGDGVTNLRSHALQQLREARAAGIPIKVPTR